MKEEGVTFITNCNVGVDVKPEQLLKEYAEMYGPLTIDSADLTDCDRWKWMEQPFPWEKEGACR